MDTVLFRVQHSPYVYPRIEGNFFSSTSSGFHFSLLGPPLASPLFACYLSRNGFPAVYFVSILVYPAYGECVSFKTYTLHPRFLFSPSILQSFLVTVPHGFSVSHISSFHFPCLVSVLFLLSTRLGIPEPSVFPSGKRGWYFRKKERLPKVVEYAVAIAELNIVQGRSFLCDTCNHERMNAPEWGN